VGAEAWRRSARAARATGDDLTLARRGREGAGRSPRDLASPARKCPSTSRWSQRRWCSFSTGAARCVRARTTRTTRTVSTLNAQHMTRAQPTSSNWSRHLPWDVLGPSPVPTRRRDETENSTVSRRFPARPRRFEPVTFGSVVPQSRPEPLETGRKVPARLVRAGPFRQVGDRLGTRRGPPPRVHGSKQLRVVADDRVGHEGRAARFRSATPTAGKGGPKRTLNRCETQTPGSAPHSERSLRGPTAVISQRPRAAPRVEPQTPGVHCEQQRDAGGATLLLFVPSGRLPADAESSCSRTSVRARAASATSSPRRSRKARRPRSCPWTR
jgi:hypothetical protein